MLPDDRHGTLVGYSRGCRCVDCTRARRIHETKRRMDADKGIRYTVPALGTHRRIRALMAIGWTSSHISQEAGFDTANAVTLIIQRERINRRTFEKIDRAYRVLCMRPGPSVISRKRAATRGWAPPLAWDDIDNDPAPIETSARRTYSVTELVDEWDFLRRSGLTMDVAAERLGVTRKAIEKAIERASGRAA